jgi:hypothetical protein
VLAVEGLARIAFGTHTTLVDEEQAGNCRSKSRRLGASGGKRLRAWIPFRSFLASRSCIAACLTLRLLSGSHGSPTCLQDCDNPFPASGWCPRPHCQDEVTHPSAVARSGGPQCRQGGECLWSLTIMVIRKRSLKRATRSSPRSARALCGYLGIVDVPRRDPVVLKNRCCSHRGRLANAVENGDSARLSGAESRYRPHPARVTTSQNARMVRNGPKLRRGPFHAFAC